MPLVDRYESGVPCWVDLATTDTNAAKEFYSGLFGWCYLHEQMSEMGIGTYSMATVDDVATAAIYELAQNQLRHSDKSEWHVYVSVKDIDSTLENTLEYRGSILAPATDVDRAGRVAVVKDSTGVQTTLWQPDQFHGSGIRAEDGAFTWTEHVSNDREQAEAFYKNVLGIETVTTPMGSVYAYTIWMTGEIAVSGMFQWPDAIIVDGVPSMWFVYFQVADLDASVDYVESNGGRAMADAPEVTGAGRTMVLRDPQGADFCIVEPHKT